MIKKRIFILEDDNPTCVIYTKLLKDYITTISSTINQALLTLKENDEFDLYILDVRIDDGTKYNGTDLIDSIRNKNKIIISSTMELKFFMKEKFNDIDYIQKDGDFIKMKNFIEKKIEQNEKKILEYN